MKRFIYAKCENSTIKELYVIIDQANDYIITWATSPKEAQEATNALNKVEEKYNPIIGKNKINL